MDARAPVTVDVDGDEVWLRWGDVDWFGPGRTLRREGVRIEAGSLGAIATLRLVAERDQEGLANGVFAEPSVGVRFDPAQRRAALPDDARAFGFQYTEFALPTHADAAMARWFLLPFRPSVVLPVGLATRDGRCLLLAPLDSFHDQVVGVPDREHPDRGLAWGWHGDLDVVPAGFASTLAVVAGDGPRTCLARLGELLLERHGTRRPSAEADALGRRISYWTDNGAAYWYKTEPGYDVASGLAATVDDLRARGIPVDAVQLDSWWYPHEVVRPFDTDEWVVPPTGLERWEARDDILPDGIADLRARLGDPPLVAHCRHLAACSPYLEEHDCWVDGDRAHPAGDDLYERYLDQCQAWGVETFEHDWLVECFLGVRGLRSEPGRARSWQIGIDRAAAARGITLQWCMGSPADFLQTVELQQVTSIRTSGDFAYLVGPGVLWAWSLLTGALARALGLRPYKDVFHADPSDPARHAEVEALLAVMSSGPVGIGDRLGRADRDLVRRACRADGVIVRPDVPLASTDASFLDHPVARAIPVVGEAWTDHPAGRWSYVVAVSAQEDQTVGGEVPLASLGESAPSAAAVLWDWRSQEARVVEPDERLSLELAPHDWRAYVLAPLLRAGVAIVGDVRCYATAGRRRIDGISQAGDVVRATVLGAGEDVELVGWAAAAPTVRAWSPAQGWHDLDCGFAGGVWRAVVAVPAAGWATVEIRP